MTVLRFPDVINNSSEINDRSEPRDLLLLTVLRLMTVYDSFAEIAETSDWAGLRMKCMTLFPGGVNPG